MVIPEYAELRKTLQDRVDLLEMSDGLYPMLAAMLQKTKTYLDEALSCDTLVMATMCHPVFRIRFFQSFFGKTSSQAFEAEATFTQEFKAYQLKNLNKGLRNPKKSSNQQQASSSKASYFNVYSDDEGDDMGDDNQLTDYLRGCDRMKDSLYNLSDPNSALEWWAVSTSPRSCDHSVRWNSLDFVCTLGTLQSVPCGCCNGKGLFVLLGLIL